MRRATGFSLILALVALGASGRARASFEYNEAGGFGLYRPDGWRAESRGRLLRIFGPTKDFARSEIAAGSDWPARVRMLEDLRRYVSREAKGAPLRTVRVSDRPGFAFEQPAGSGAIFVLREPGNVLELRYELRGSAAQREEGREILESFTIRTEGIEYP